MRSAKSYSESPPVGTIAGTLGLGLINAPALRQGFFACISSRITTVIHVSSLHPVNYN